MRLQWREDQAGWEHLATTILKVHLKLARMTYVDLERELATLGVKDHHKLISARVQNGRFSAAFLLQALAIAGVREISLPVRPNNPDGHEHGDPDR